jgi:hypothetical protein
MIIYIVYDPGCYTTINNTYSPSSRRLVGKFMNLLYIICKLNNYNICRGGGWQYIRARDLLFVTATFCIYNTVLYSTLLYSMYIRYSNLSTSPASRRLAGNASKEK